MERRGPFDFFYERLNLKGSDEVIVRPSCQYTSGLISLVCEELTKFKDGLTNYTEYANRLSDTPE